MKDLTGRVAVVTGASAGIGRAIARELASAGCTVALLARGHDALDLLQRELTKAGATALAISCDLGDASAMRAALEKVEAELGPVDILINNVGAGTFKPLHQMSAQECDIAIQLPLLPALTAVHALVPGMRARGVGHIVNLTSPAGIFPLPFMVPYTSARHAMVGLSESLYEELRGTGVGVSLVCPAQVNTGYFERNDADMGWYPKISSLFPVSEPEQVARRVVTAIRKNEREVVFPALLWAAVATFRKMPRLSIRLFRMLGLWGPSDRLTAAPEKTSPIAD
ncbi:MAG: SDR family NAD(P)-dependent oxidoreductase [Alcanivoracaceae bacterium]|nr:SDR family NAD(P)-dependent oxidoreductase [Alcanivoracaceae bacterium]